MKLSEVLEQLQEIAKQNPKLLDQDVAVTGLYGSFDFDLEIKVGHLRCFDSVERVVIETFLSTG